MNEKQPLVSVVIVTWNRRDDVLETVQSVYEQGYANVEIIVVDNASRDDTVAALGHAYPDVRVIALERNIGAAAGRNAGIAVAEGEIIFLLDSDASLDYMAISSVVQRFASDPGVGVLYCKIVNYYTRQFDNIAGWIFSEKKKVDQNREFAAFGFSECGSAFRRDVFERVGMFWDELFFIREAEDLGLRILDAGYTILYFPASVVYHRVSPQRRFVGGEREYFNARNSLYISVVRYPWWLLIVVVPLRLLALLIGGVRRRYLGQMWRAVRDVGRRLPQLLRERRPISNQTARYLLELYREQGALSWGLVDWLRYKT